MPRLIPRARRWKPDELVRPLQPFSVDHDGVPVVLNPRDRLRADHPIVKRLSGHFVRVEASDDEVREVMAEEFAKRPLERGTPGVFVPKPIPVGEAVVAVDSFHAGGLFSYRHVAKGQRLRRDDPIVVANPTLFVNEATPIEKAG